MCLLYHMHGNGKKKEENLSRMELWISDIPHTHDRKQSVIFNHCRLTSI